MNRWIKAYVRQVKHLFPFFSQTEKAYLERLQLNLEDCFEGQEPNSMEAVIAQMGRPESVVEEYLDQMNISHVEDHTRKSAKWRIATTCVALILLIIVAITSVLVWNSYEEFLQRIDEETGYWVETIE